MGNNLEKLFIGRHATRERGGESISEFGRMESEEIAKRIQEIVDDRVVQILSSSAPRAPETANIIGEILGAPVQLSKKLWDDGEYWGDPHGSLDLIRGSEAPAIVVVTHAPFTRVLPNLFGEEELGGTDLGCRPLPPASTWHIDTHTKTAERLNPF